MEITQEEQQVKSGALGFS